MAAPTVTIYEVTGVDASPSRGASIVSLDFGNVIAGNESSCKAVQYLTSGNSISTAVIWNQSDFADPTNINPYVLVQLAYQNPAGFLVASGFAEMGTTAGAGTSVDEATSNDDQIAAMGYSEYVYFIIDVGAGASDGADSCVARLSFNYP